MESVDRIIGALQEHKESTNCRLDRIEGKIDSLQNFKWKAVGALTVVTFVITVACDLARAMFK